jgi:hypothetical protein
MNALDFYLNVFRVAITHSVETAHVVVFACVIIVGVVTRYVPEIRELIWERIGHYFPAADNIENWQVGLVILVFVILARLVAAPFWIWEAEHQNLIAATAKISTLNAQLEDRERTRAIRRELGVFLEQGRQLMTVCADETKAPPSAEGAALNRNLDNLNSSPEFVVRSLGQNFTFTAIHPRIKCWRKLKATETAHRRGSLTGG